MGSSMSSLYIGVSGLNVSQSGLNNTAHNISNVDTKGYTRQQVLIKDSQYLNIGYTSVGINQVGSGVDVEMIRQVRNSFLDQSYRSEAGRESFYQVQAEAYEEVEEILGKMDGVAFQDSIENLWQSMHELSKEPDSIVKRGLLINMAGSFIEKAQVISEQLSDYQVNLNVGIMNQVNRINEIGEEIYALNDKISRMENSGGQSANDLRDARNLLIDELSQMVSITYKENSDSSVSINVEGTSFVSQSGVNHMELKKVSDTSQMLKPTWKELDQDVYYLEDGYKADGVNDVGSLKSLLITRGNYEANYKDIPVKPVQEEYEDEAAYDKAMAQYNRDVESYNKLISSSAIMNVQSQFDQLINGIVTKINDILCPNTTIEYQKEDGTIGTMTILDTSKAPVGMGEGNQEAGNELFVRQGTDRYKEVTIKDKDGNPITVMQYQEEDASDVSKQYSIQGISVNKKLVDNVSLLAIHKNDKSGEFDQEVCDGLTNMWNEAFATLSPNTLTKTTFKEYYNALIGELANNAETVNVIYKNQQSTATSLNNQRTQVSGVSSDEELGNMIKFQHAYNASSRYISVVSDMLEDIVTNFIR